MSGQVFLMTETFSTFQAGVFFPCVNVLMLEKVGTLAKTLPALRAFIWFLPSVNSLMFGEVYFLTETLLTF